MAERPQRDFRNAKKQDRFAQIVQNVNETIRCGHETLTKKADSQGEIYICIKYFNGGICGAVAEVKDTVNL